MTNIVITETTEDVRPRIIRNAELEAALAIMRPGSQFLVPDEIDDRVLRSAVGRASRTYSRVALFRTTKTRNGARVVVADKPQ